MAFDVDEIDVLLRQFVLLLFPAQKLLHDLHVALRLIPVRHIEEIGEDEYAIDDGGNRFGDLRKHVAVGIVRRKAGDDDANKNDGEEKEHFAADVLFQIGRIAAADKEKIYRRIEQSADGDLDEKGEPDVDGRQSADDHRNADERTEIFGNVLHGIPARAIEKHRPHGTAVTVPHGGNGHDEHDHIVDELEQGILPAADALVCKFSPRQKTVNDFDPKGCNQTDERRTEKAEIKIRLTLKKAPEHKLRGEKFDHHEPESNDRFRHLLPPPYFANSDRKDCFLERLMRNSCPPATRYSP